MRLSRYLWGFICAAALSALCGCGSPGAPLPPSLEVPRPVRDLHASRKGNKVSLTWTVPTLTTEHQTIRHFGPTLICHSLDVAISDCGKPVAELPPTSVRRSSQNKSSAPLKEQASYTDMLPQALQQENPVAQVTYAVAVLNRNLRSAGLSNRVQVPAAPTLPPPSSLNTKVTENGIVLTWSTVQPPPAAPGLQFLYRVYRRELSPREHGGTTETAIGQLPLETTEFLDHSFEWEKSYAYRVCVVTTVSSSGGAVMQVEGDDSPTITVLAHDVFPPAVPSGLQAVASGVGQPPFIDLIWAPNTEPDLAGYNVHRRQGNEEWKKINPQLVQTPAYRDTSVAPGNKYSYAVSAVDLRGNESGRSAEASETTP